MLVDFVVLNIESWICTAGRHFLGDKVFFYILCHSCVVWLIFCSYNQTCIVGWLLEGVVYAGPYTQI